MGTKIERHTICVLVDNEAGVLARVIGLFSGRGYNIESLTVAEVEKAQRLSRITVVTTGTPPGVGLGQKPQVWLNVGDQVSLGIQGLGQQTQTVVAA